MPRPLVVQTEQLERGPAAWLAERCELVTCPYTDAQRLDGLLARAEGLIVRTYTRVNASFLAKCPKLRAVGRAGVALDNVDVAACRARGVQVVHTPGANTRAVVELVAAFMVDALRPRERLERAIPEPDWHALRQRLTAPRQLSDLTLGIYGLGRIGSGVARLGASLEMRILYNDLLEIPAPARHGAAPVSPADLLASSDILTVHVDAREQNRHLINAAALARLKRGAILINTSRGLVVDPHALSAWLRADPTARAYLDVHDPFEPITPDYPLLSVPNAVLTPHIASGTETAKTNMSWVVRDVWRVLSGEKPEFPAPAS